MAEEKKNMNPIEEHLYEERKDFCIVALTGVLGSGFDNLTKVMTSKESLLDSVRAPQDIHVPYCSLTDIDHSEENKKYLSKLLFHRKYTICYNYIKDNYAEYTILKYNKVLWYYTLRYFAQQVSERLQLGYGENGSDLLYDKVKELLFDKYAPYNFENRIDDESTTYSLYLKENINPKDILEKNAIDFQALYDQMSILPDFTNESCSGDKIEIAEAFFDASKPFFKFYEAIRKAMLEDDLYLYCMFHWRLGICIRALKDPSQKMGLTKAEEINVTNNNDGLFDIVRLITTIIKGYHKSDILTKHNGTRICVDSLRNSFEARYLQERFSAFYLINVLNADVRAQLGKLVEEENGGQSEERQKLIKTSIYQLYKKEATSEVDDGHLAMHDVDTCVSNAEIHITNRDDVEGDENVLYKNTHFYFLAEQWMKFASLIQRPGLFTPDTEERCMQIAYTAKFNSGCISRQVGAVITNKDGSIRTIGWNDPPQGQVPCALRDTADLLQIKADDFTPASNEQVSMMYSEFETGGKYDIKEKDFIEQEDYKIYGGKNFKEELPYREIERFKIENKSLHLPYCFKQCHTAWYEKDSGNQFHQRAIHAEENAMMQMVKYGGEALKGGIIYVTASPCEICSKKLYQIGVKKIVFIDPYPGIAPWQVIQSGLLRPELVYYEGVYGASYFKLYSHFVDYKNELKVRGVTFTDKQEQKFDKKQISEFVDHGELLLALRSGEEYTCTVMYQGELKKAKAKLHKGQICFLVDDLQITSDITSVNGKKYNNDVMMKIWNLLNTTKNAK